jgi:hypothetical protein
VGLFDMIGGVASFVNAHDPDPMNNIGLPNLE